MKPIVRYSDSLQGERMKGASLQVLFFLTLSLNSRYNTRHLLNVLAVGCVEQGVCDLHL